jgi:hypothetical protein
MGKIKDVIEEVRVYGVSSTIADDLSSIASHMSVGRSAFLKMELRKIRDSYPPYMLIPKKKEQDY